MVRDELSFMEGEAVGSRQGANQECLHLKEMKVFCRAAAVPQSLRGGDKSSWQQTE